MKRKIFCFCLMICILLPLFSGCSEKRTPGGTLTVALPQGEAAWQGLGFWSADYTAQTVADLVTGYSPVIKDQSDRYVPNTAVTLSLTDEGNPDGSKTFTVVLRPDLCFSDGTPLNALHYAAALLVFASPEAAALGADTAPWCSYLGYDDYLQGKPLTGFQLKDDYTFCITVAPNYIPDCQELSYLDFSPIDTSLWLSADAVIHADEEGVFLTFEAGISSLTYTISTALAQTAQSRSVGPYCMVESNATGMTLRRNTQYRAADASEAPVIDEICFTYTEDPVAAVQDGSADICLHTDLTAEQLADLQTDSSLTVAKTAKNTFTDLIFACDTAPTDSVALRQAVYCLANLTAYTAAIGGPEAVAPGFITAADMWYSPETDASRSAGTFAAADLLTEDGWRYGENGTPYVVGLRYRIADSYAEGDLVTEDGTILRPLRLKALISRGAATADFIGTLRSEAQQVGMEISIELCSSSELESRLTRDAGVSFSYAEATAHIFITEVSTAEPTDFPARFTADGVALYSGSNLSFLQDELLYRSALKLAHTDLSEGDFSRMMKEFYARWYELTPEIPLAQGFYRDIYNTRLRGYSPTETGGFARAVLKAWLSEK